MIRINSFRKAGFALVASLLMTTALPDLAKAETQKIEFDSNLLQQLDPSAAPTVSAAPTTAAMVPNGPGEKDLSPVTPQPSPYPDPVVKKQSTEVKPILSVKPGEISAPASDDSYSLLPAPASQKEDIKKPGPVTERDVSKEVKAKIAASLAAAKGPGNKPQAKPAKPIVQMAKAEKSSAAPTASTLPIPAVKPTPPAAMVATLTKPAVPLEKPAPVVLAAAPIAPAVIQPVVEAEAKMPKAPLNKIVAQAAPSAPAQPTQVAANNTPAPATVTESPTDLSPVTSIPMPEKSKDITAPPPTMVEAQGIKAPVGNAVSFPIKVSTKNRGSMNPDNSGSENATPLTPAVAVAAAEPKPVPGVAYRNVPLPKERPNVIVASKDFVAKARRSYEDSYVVVKRDGDKMPAIPKQTVQTETLTPSPARSSSPSRLSVADIASDPLASKLVSMSPNEIASALNDMAPAAGGGGHQAVIADVRGRMPVKIVRENGNWPQKKTDDAAAAKLVSLNGPAEAPKDGRYIIEFKAGATDLPQTSFGEVDSGIVFALRSDADARVQIVAYADAPDGKEGTARRLSLSRGLSVRSYLISKGIDATRVDVRAMGMKPDSKSGAEQVEMTLIQPGAKKT